MRLIWLAPLLAVGLAGCIPVGGGPGGGFVSAGPATREPTDFNVEPPIDNDVVADPLAPLGSEEGIEPGDDESILLDPLAGPDDIGQPDQAAMLAANSDIEITNQDLSGSWTLFLEGGTCSLNFSLTPWDDRLRASTISCQSDALAAVSSWQIENQTVVLYAGSDVVARFVVANLVRDGDSVLNGRFEGQMTAGGTAVSFIR